MSVRKRSSNRSPTSGPIPKSLMVPLINAAQAPEGPKLLSRLWAESNPSVRKILLYPASATIPDIPVEKRDFCLSLRFQYSSAGK